MVVGRTSQSSKILSMLSLLVDMAISCRAMTFHFSIYESTRIYVIYISLSNFHVVPSPPQAGVI